MGALLCVHNSCMYVFIGMCYVYIGLLYVLIHQMHTVVCAGSLHFLLSPGPMRIIGSTATLYDLLQVSVFYFG